MEDQDLWPCWASNKQVSIEGMRITLSVGGEAHGRALEFVSSSLGYSRGPAARFEDEESSGDAPYWNLAHYNLGGSVEDLILLSRDHGTNFADEVLGYDIEEDKYQYLRRDSENSNGGCGSRLALQECCVSLQKQMDRVMDMLDSAHEVYEEATKGRVGPGAYPFGFVPDSVKLEFEKLSGTPWSNEVFEAWERIRPLALLTTMATTGEGVGVGGDRYRVYVVDKRTQKPLPADEPIFIVRGKDLAAYEMVSIYREQFAKSPEQQRSLLSFAAEIERWQKKNPNRVRVSD
jgi:hypothetical protein